jgi:endonuclease YncB( thermonuclease family)
MAKVQTAKVIQVIDGDTIDVSIDGVEQRVRYIGIDSPEMDFPLGAQAQAENAKLVEGQEVLLITDISETDRYHRLLRYVIANKVFVNEALVRSGFAMSKGYTPDTACQEAFDQAEAEAKAAGLGLWAPTPIPSPGSATSDNPSASLVIQHIFFDGLVRRVESDEYAEIANTGATAVDLTGWRLNAGNPGQDFVFPRYMIEAGQSCRVYTNETHAESGGFSFASKDPIWNNQGDCGYLYDSQGKLIDDYCY